MEGVLFHLPRSQLTDLREKLTTAFGEITALVKQKSLGLGFKKGGCYRLPWAPKTYMFKGLYGNLVFRLRKPLFFTVLGAHGSLFFQLNAFRLFFLTDSMFSFEPDLFRAKFG